MCGEVRKIAREIKSKTDEWIRSNPKGTAAEKAAFVERLINEKCPMAPYVDISRCYTAVRKKAVEEMLGLELSRRKTHAILIDPLEMPTPEQQACVDLAELGMELYQKYPGHFTMLFGDGATADMRRHVWNVSGIRYSERKLWRRTAAILRYQDRTGRERDIKNLKRDVHILLYVTKGRKEPSEEEVNQACELYRKSGTGQHDALPIDAVACAIEIFGILMPEDHPAALLNRAWLQMSYGNLDQDLEEPLALLEKAAGMGEPLAMFYLGSIYDNQPTAGLMQRRRTKYTDYEKAAYWYRKGYETGEPNASMRYAEVLYLGLGVRKNRRKAFDIFMRLFEGGHHFGTSFYLGQYYQNGIIVEKDFRKALKYYHAGSATGHDVWSLCNLGAMYYTGSGVKQNYKTALSYYRKAAEMGDAHSMTNIGWCCEHGHGVKKDIDKAIEWYTKGAMLHDGDAIDEIERLKATHDISYVCSMELYNIKAENGASQTCDISIQNGNLVVTGNDFGSEAIKSFYGPDIDSYEYIYTFDEGKTEKVMSAMGVKKASDLMYAICDKYGYDFGETDFIKFCKGKGIEPRFFCWDSYH